MTKRHPRMTPARTLTLTGGLSGARLSKTLFCSALLSSTLLTGCGGDTATQTDLSKTDTSKPATGWNLVWSDEFDGQSIDSNKWNFEVNCAGGGNNEKQCYTADKANAFTSGGMLNIVAKPAATGAEKPYTSARITTKKKADFKYGRFEMRAKLPSGQGAWPAFWMMPTDSVYGDWPRSGEIDIMEAVNLKVKDAKGNVESNVHGTLHYGKPWPNNSSSGKNYTLPGGKNPADDFHTYAVEWQQGEIRWYVDDYLYATQRQSEVRLNSKDQAVGLKHRGWFTEYFDQTSGKLNTYWTSAPFDQKFFLILNFAVGGNWPENVNNKGIDAAAFTNGQSFVVDYVRAYQCAANPDTGKGCETVRPGYDKTSDALVEGKAPIPVPPSDGVARNLAIFDNAENPSWPGWDCCGGSKPTVVNDNQRGGVMEFRVGGAPTVNGFISRAEFIKDPAGTPSPFDASPLANTGSLSFAMKAVSLPNNAAAVWKLKVESNNAASAVEMDLTASNEGKAPAAGVWQTYTFPLKKLADAGLDLSAIDVVMIFPAWGTGEGAVYQVDDVKIAGPGSAAPSLTLFKDSQNLDWPMWDCCAGSKPTEQLDDAAHGMTAEFTIGGAPTVMGFITRPSNNGGNKPFDASAILAKGVVKFDLKVVTAPNDPASVWKFKVEANNAASAVELNLTDSVEGKAPVTGQWQTYTFKLSDLAAKGLDVSAIDVVMIFPAWGTGNGAVYRVDNASIGEPAVPSNSGLTLFADAAAANWSLWDCCGGSKPTVEDDDAAHGKTAQYKIGGAPTVMGIFAADGTYFDASNILATAMVKFEMKVVTPPSDSSADWLFKIEAKDAASAVQLKLSESLEGKAPVVGQWQTYSYRLKDLADKGLDVSAIDIVMVFPAWGQGNGAVYRLDNVQIK
ncbi:family 16 glycosylhydrolase [Rheinheimera tilapiae]|uniref:Family 16 glycosylhydrolase n=1 Tax=Rheinheimera tilapiae TaxID=875043 RepID=A0ABV6BB80_9GAMM